MSHNLDSATIERLVAAAVAAVLAEMRPTQPAAGGRRVAVLVSETPVGLDFAAASLATLSDFQLHLKWLVIGRGVAAVNRRLGAELCRDIDAAGCPLALAREVEAVVAATLDRPTAVRVAQTMPETFGSKLVLEALCLGKPVVAATDALGLDRPDATPQLRHALAEPVGRLEVFGATCVEAVDLGPTLRTLLSGPGGVNAHENRPLITAVEVEAADGELLLPPDAIVTPLALDRARELGVKLRRLPS